MRKNSLLLFATLLMSAAALAGCAGDDAAPALKSAQAPLSATPANPDNLDADLRHAEAQRAAHDLAGATHTISQLMLVAPDDPRVVGEYGKVLAERGRAREAVDFLTRATQLKSNDWRIYSALGVAEDQLGKPKAARAAYEQALALKPDEPSVLNNYALSCLLANDPATALRLIHMAEAHGGKDNPKIMRNIALIRSVAAQTGAAPAAAKPAAAAHPAIAAAPHAAPQAKVQKTALQPVHPAAQPPHSYAQQNTAMQQSTAGFDPRYSVEHSTRPPGPAAPQRTASEHASHATDGVVMQAVPFDPLAGPVKDEARDEAKPAAAKHEEKREATRAPHKLAAHKHAAHHAAIREAEKHETAKSETKVAAKPAHAKAKHAEIASRSAPPPLRMSANASLP